MAAKNLELAVASYQNAVSVEWRPFLIDAGTKVEGEDYVAYNARRWGGDGWTRSLRAKGRAVGAQFSSWRYWPNALRAHRLMRCAQRQEAETETVKTALFKACYEEGKNISSTETLAQIGAACGLAEGDEAAVSSYLASDDGEREVIEECRNASRSGVSGVPYFIIDGDAVDRPYGFSGAISANELLELFEEVSGTSS